MAAATEAGTSATAARRIDWLVFLFILFAGCLFWVFSEHVEDIAPDSSTYQGLAHSLRTSGAYAFNFAPHIQYPPGLPLLLAGIASVFGEDHLAYLRFMAVTGMLGLWIAYAFLRQEQGRAVAAIGTLLLGSSLYYFLFAAIVVNADIPYLFASIAALFLGKQLEASHPNVRTLALAVAFGLALLLSVLLRTAGIALLGGYGLWLALSFARSRTIPVRRLVAFGVPLGVALTAQAAWLLRAQQVKAQALSGWGGAYAEVFRLLDPHRPELGYASFADILARIPGNLVQHSAHLSELASGLPWIDQLWYSPLVLVPMGLVALGFLDSARRRQGAVEWYLLLYAIIYSLWPYDVGARFVLPIFPIAFLYAWRATGVLGQAVRKHPAQSALAGCLFCLAVGVAALAVHLDADSPASLQARISPFFWLAASMAFGAMSFRQFRASAIVLRGREWLLRPLPIGPLGPSVAQWVGVLLVAVLVLLGIVEQLAEGIKSSKASSSGITHIASVEAANWIKLHARAHDVVMAQQLSVVHYVSGRRVVGFPSTGNPERIIEVIRGNDVRYLVVISSRTGMNTLPPEVERLERLRHAYRELLQPAHAGAGFQVFRIVR